jgi:beta-glucosidase
MRVYLEPATETGRVPIDTIYLDNTEMFLVDYYHPKLTSTTWYSEVEGFLTPDESGEFVFSLSVAGTALLYVDGKMVVENEKNQTPGDSFFGAGSAETKASIHLEAGKTYTVLVTHGTLPTSDLRTPGATAMGAGGLRIGGMKAIDNEIEIEKAVELAKTVDQVVICAGLNVSPQLNPPPSPQSTYVLLTSLVNSPTGNPKATTARTCRSPTPSQP